VTNKVIITTTKTQLTQAREWIDTTLPTIYSQHISDKLDVTTLKNLMPRRLDKPILTAASTAYATKLKQRTTATTMPTGDQKKYAKPPRPHKQRQVGLAFDEKEFPALPTRTTQQSQPTPSVTTTDTSNTARSASNSAAAAITTNTTPYDYKAELARISTEIEAKLKTQFEDLFVQMERKLDNFMTHYATQKADQDQKLDTFMRQQAQQKIEQDRFNETFTKQLDYLVDNMQRFLKLANLPPLSKYPSPNIGDGIA